MHSSLRSAQARSTLRHVAAQVRAQARHAPRQSLHTAAPRVQQAPKPAMSKNAMLALLGSVITVAGATTAVALCEDGTLRHKSNINDSVANAYSGPNPLEDTEFTELYKGTHPSHEELKKADVNKLTHAQLAELFNPPKSSENPGLLGGLLASIGLGSSTPLVPPAINEAELPLIYTTADKDSHHQRLERLVRAAQMKICDHILDMEQLGGPSGPGSTTNQPSSFVTDMTVRPDGSGGGIVRVLQGGRVFEKAGINISVSNTTVPPAAFDRLLPDHPSLNGKPRPKGNFHLFAASISLVLHPVNPHVPTSHANWRYFEATLENGEKVWWYGGGSDLTPTYVVDDDARHFHRVLKNCLDPIDKSYYPAWKKWCDEYFWIKHRKENRGIGGVFYDDLHTSSKQHYYELMHTLSQAFSAQYFPVVMKNKDKAWTDEDRHFQLLRRGRYVEFNLCYDKGTTWGLAQAVARPDAILMSLPWESRFIYKQKFTNDKQKYTYDVLTNPKKWV